MDGCTNGDAIQNCKMKRRACEGRRLALKLSCYGQRLHRRKQTFMPMRSAFHKKVCSLQRMLLESLLVGLHWSAPDPGKLLHGIYPTPPAEMVTKKFNGNFFR